MPPAQNRAIALSRSSPHSSQTIPPSPSAATADIATCAARGSISQTSTGGLNHWAAISSGHRSSRDAANRSGSAAGSTYSPECDAP